MSENLSRYYADVLKPLRESIQKANDSIHDLSITIKCASSLCDQIIKQYSKDMDGAYVIASSLSEVIAKTKTKHSLTSNKLFPNQSDSLLADESISNDFKLKVSEITEELNNEDAQEIDSILKIPKLSFVQMISVITLLMSIFMLIHSCSSSVKTEKLLGELVELSEKQYQYEQTKSIENDKHLVEIEDQLNSISDKLDNNSDINKTKCPKK